MTEITIRFDKGKTIDVDIEKSFDCITMIDIYTSLSDLKTMYGRITGWVEKL